MFVFVCCVTFVCSVPIDARTCQDLVHLKWRDGSIVHLFLTERIVVCQLI
jgi:hypothetical protein